MCVCVCYFFSMPLGRTWKIQFVTGPTCLYCLTLCPLHTVLIDWSLKINVLLHWLCNLVNQGGCQGKCNSALSQQETCLSSNILPSSSPVSQRCLSGFSKADAEMEALGVKICIRGPQLKGRRGSMIGQRRSSNCSSTPRISASLTGGTKGFRVVLLQAEIYQICICLTS